MSEGGYRYYYVLSEKALIEVMDRARAGESNDDLLMEIYTVAAHSELGGTDTTE